MSIQTIQPATGEVLETFEPYSAAQINEILDEARIAFTRWRTTTFAERGAILHKVAAHLRKHKEELAVTATEEMGKPIVEAEAEVEKCAWNCDLDADNAEKFLADVTHYKQRNRKLCLVLTPRRYFSIDALELPLLGVFRSAAPALMAGNTSVLKHASNVDAVRCKSSGFFTKAAFRMAHSEPS